jgi:hypothetical protein
MTAGGATTEGATTGGFTAGTFAAGGAKLALAESPVEAAGAMDGDDAGGGVAEAVVVDAGSGSTLTGGAATTVTVG